MTLQSKESFLLNINNNNTGGMGTIDEVKYKTITPLQKSLHLDIKLDNLGNSGLLSSRQNSTYTSTNMTSRAKNVSLFLSPNAKRDEMFKNQEPTLRLRTETLEDEDVNYMKFEPSLTNDLKRTAQARLERAKNAYKHMKNQEQKVSTQRKTTNFAQKFYENALQNDKIIRNDLNRQAENLRKKLEKRSLEAKGFKNPDIMAKFIEKEGITLDTASTEHSGSISMGTSFANPTTATLTPLFDPEKSGTKIFQESLANSIRRLFALDLKNMPTSTEGNQTEYNTMRFNTEPDSNDTEFDKKFLVKTERSNPLLAQIMKGNRNPSSSPNNSKQSKENIIVDKIENEVHIKNEPNLDFLSPKSEIENIGGSSIDEVKQKLMAMKKRLKRGTTTAV